MFPLFVVKRFYISKMRLDQYNTDRKCIASCFMYLLFWVNNKIIPHPRSHPPTLHSRQKNMLQTKEHCFWQTCHLLVVLL